MSIFVTTVTDVELEEIRYKLDEAIFKFKTRPLMSTGYFECTRNQVLIVVNAQFKKWKKENKSKLNLFDRFAKITEVYVQQDHFCVKMPDSLNAGPVL